MSRQRELLLSDVVIPSSSRHTTLDRYHFTFNPRQRGIRKILGDLEAEVMEVVWSLEHATVRDVHERLAERDLAYTTVMTVMSRLSHKGLLEKDKEGAAYLYSPAVSREEFTRSTVGTVLSELLEDFTPPAMAEFVELLGEQDDSAIDELARLVEKKRTQRNGDF